jgi:Mrp family chromosome partitioning ATPase
MSLMLNTLKTLEGRRHFATPHAFQAASDAPRLRICTPAEDVAPLAPIASPNDEVMTACLAPTIGEVAEPYLDLAARVTSQLAPSQCHVLLFVGADRNCAEQFSLIQVAEAVSLQAAQGVLLIDGDLSNRVLSRAAANPTPGLCDVLQAAVDWQAAIRRTQIAGLDFMPAGERELDEGPYTEPDWQCLRSCYQAVLIGTAESDGPAAQWLATRADATYLVVSRASTRRRDAVSALNRLRAHRANVLGSVVIDD